MRTASTLRAAALLAAVLLLGAATAPAAPTLGGPLPPPSPLFPRTNWWNLDVTTAPVDPNSAAFITFINNGGNRRVHPDFGGDVSPGSVQNYGISYVVVDGTQPKLTVNFLYVDESDGVDHTTETPIPFYPIPAEAITNAHWVEGGDPGDVDLRCCGDRHILVVDRDNNHLYELWNCWYDTANAQWEAGSGAFFDLSRNDRRPDGWTSADAAGLAILPGLVRYDEAFGTAEIEHAFRVTVRATADYYVWPASHRAGNTPGALPLGARLRLKAGFDISGFEPENQRIFRAMKKYGLIVADNGTDMFVSGAYDVRWDNGLLNPDFHSLHANDFDVIELGWNPPAVGPALLRDATITDIDPVTPALALLLPLDAGDLYQSPIAAGFPDPLPAAGPLVLYALDSAGPMWLVKDVAASTVRVFY